MAIKYSLPKKDNISNKPPYRTNIIDNIHAIKTKIDITVNIKSQNSILEFNNGESPETAQVVKSADTVFINNITFIIINLKPLNLFFFLVLLPELSIKF